MVGDCGEQLRRERWKYARGMEIEVGWFLKLDGGLLGVFRWKTERSIIGRRYLYGDTKEPLNEPIMEGPADF